MSQKPPILLMPQGSAGDVHPFVGIGLELQRRGYAVTLATNGYFQGLAKQVGLPFIEVGTAEQFDEATNDPNLWKPGIPGTRVVFGMSVKVLPQQFELISKQYAQDNRLIVVAGPLAFGARVAAEKLDVKHVTVQLAPAVFISSDKPPRLPGLFMPTWLPRWVKQLIWNIASAVVDRIACPPINAYRREIGLDKPMKRVLAWWNSPLLTICMFPQWFASVPADWPASVKLSGFGLYDEKLDEQLSDDVKMFLDKGDKPIVFTPGSANKHGRAFFQESLKVCKMTGRRGIFLSRYSEHIPKNLPVTVKHFAYVPLSQLLPHCAALVYHGGIGTLSQACKAGIPHLVVKLAHDQYDNAQRLEKLGMGRSCKPSEYKAPYIARLLTALFASSQTQQICQQIVGKMACEDGIGRTCDLIEKWGVK